MKRKEASKSQVSTATSNVDDVKHAESRKARDTSSLYASAMTVDCAHRGCVPCAYKIGSFDVSLDKEFCKQVPNQRPEQCPRVSETTARNGTLGFEEGMSVLTVGDGDFSFSLAVARLLCGENCRPSLVVTSYEDKTTLQNVYGPGFLDTLAELETLGAKVCFKVDATALKATCPILESKTFHRICWNFPCTAIAKGQDGQNVEMEQNKDLVRRFVANSLEFLSRSDGEVLICHKTKPPFNQWRLEHVALENIKGEFPAALDYAGRVILDRFLLPPYTPRKALDRKSFPCHDACFYVFGLTKTEDSNGQQKYPPTIGSESTHSDVVPITPNLVQAIRSSMLRRMLSRGSNQPNQKKRKVPELGLG
jgi:hypothetical protein